VRKREHEREKGVRERGSVRERVIVCARERASERKREKGSERKRERGSVRERG
jgi:hypothetical protein